MTKKQINDWIEEYNNAIDYLVKLKEDKNEELNKLYWEIKEYEDKINELKDKIHENYERIKELKKLLDLSKEDNENE